MDSVSSLETSDLWKSTFISSQNALAVAEVLLNEGLWWESHRLQECIINTFGIENIEPDTWEVVSGLKRKAYDTGLLDLNTSRKRLRRGGNIVVDEHGNVLLVDDSGDCYMYL